MPLSGSRKHTINLPSNTCLDTPQTLAELGLRGAQLAEGRCEVLELVVELLFYAVELLRGQGGEVDWAC